MSATRHYLALDGLRGVAALAVVSLHISEYFGLPAKPYHAYLAVDFFFMLSGFVIAHAYDDKLRQGMGVRSFLKARLVRLQPLVLLGVALGAIVCLLRAGLGGFDMAGVLRAAIANMLLLPTPVLLAPFPSAFPLDVPLWSLAFEIWINLLYALFFKILTRFTLLLLLAVGALLVLAVSLGDQGLNVGFELHDFYLGGARVLFPFVMGVLLRRYAGSTQHMAWAHLMFVPLLLVLCAPALGGGWFDIGAVLVVFPVILLVASRAPVSRRLDPLWRQFGLLSYPVYVLHYPFVFILSKMLHLSHAGIAASWLMGLATIVLVVILSALANRFYDVPVRAWVSGRLAMPPALARVRP